MFVTIRRHWRLLTASLLMAPALTYAAAPKWTGQTLGEAYVEIRDYSENKQILADCQEKHGVLQEDLELVKHRIGRKEQLLDLLQSGRVTLSEAGEQFLEIDRECEQAFHSQYRPGSFSECAQARVIRFLRIRHSDTTQERQFQPLVDRLSHEFETRFGYPPPRE